MSRDSGYVAFISYSHHDERWANWLQRAIERYRTPKRLVGRDGAHGPVPARPGRVFLDRQELAASAELSDSVDDALSASDFLLVVCSPAAAASQWVGKEVLRFKQLHGEGRVLCLVVDGDPTAEDETASFPLPVRFALAADGTLGEQRVEPLAADVRPGADGKALARQKLLAGLLGVPLDALRQREQQRKQRVMATVTAASLAGMAFTGWLAWTAMLAREDAERRQGQAEDLVEFILSDLQQGLQKVGRLDIMKSAASEAQAYFAGLDVRDLTEEALQGHAESLRQLGDLQLGQGESEAAFEAFEEAWRMDSELLARSPDDAQLLFNLGQSEFWLGYARLEAGDAENALAHFNAYMDISQQLYDRDANHVDWVMELCYAHNNLAYVLADLGQAEAGIGHMRQSLAYNLEALALAPDDVGLVRELAFSEGWLATILRITGNLPATLEPRRSSILRWQALHEAEPADAATRSELALNLRQQGYVQAALGKPDEALAHLDRSVGHFAALSEIDPDNTLWTLERLGGLLDAHRLAPDDAERAAALAEAVERLALPLAEAPPETPAYRGWLAQSLAHGAGLGQDIAPGLLSRALDLARSAQEDSPGEPTVLGSRADVLAEAIALGSPEAPAQVDEVLNAARRLDIIDPLVLNRLLRLELVARPEAVDTRWLDRLWASGFRHPAFLALCEATAGCTPPTEHTGASL